MMSDVDVVVKAIEFIETHLTEHITVADIAESVSFSLYHFSRTFSQVTRHTPYDYLMRRRLCEAARCLLESEEKITDVAFMYQFNALESFSRAFKRMFHLQPREVKAQHWLDYRQLMPRATPEYLAFLHSANPLKPIATKLPAMRIGGIAAPIHSLDSESTVLALWDSVRRGMRCEKPPLHPREYYGVLMFFPYSLANQHLYLAGTRLTEDEELPPFFVEKNISAIDYACFELSKQTNAARFTRNYIYHTWWPKVTKAPLALFEIERWCDHPDQQSGGWHPQALYSPLGS